MPLLINPNMFPIHEAEDDNEPTDYTVDDGGTENTPPQENPDDAGTNDTPEEAPEDYTVPDDNDEGDDTTPDEGEDDEPTGDTGEDDNTGMDDAGEDDDTGVDDDDEVKNLEKDIFDNLSEDQMKIKVMELRKRYLDLYENCITAIDRINDSPKSEETIKQLTFVSNKLEELSNMIADYLENTFNAVSYIESEINFSKFLGVLNGINDVLGKIGIPSKKKENKE